MRMASPGAIPICIAALEADMPRGVPLGRWDADAPALQKHSARFSGFLEGADAAPVSSVEIGFRDSPGLSIDGMSS